MTKLEELDEMIKVQCSDGNWNYDHYMHGMANGMICAGAIIADEEPVYLGAPEVWVKDEPDISKPTVSPDGHKSEEK